MRLLYSACTTILEGWAIVSTLDRRMDEMTSNQYWWPNQLNLKALRQNSPASDPMGKAFNYAEEFRDSRRR